jgi:hypothetical protein
LTLLKFSCASVLLPSSVTVRGAVIFPKKFAEAVAPSGTSCGSQFAALLHTPSASTPHCGERTPPSSLSLICVVGMSCTSETLNPLKIGAASDKRLNSASVIGVLK